MAVTAVITTVEELRQHMSDGGDTLNIFVATEAMAHRGGREKANLRDATKLQIEGYVLHPRKATAFPVEIVTADRNEAAYIMRLVITSQSPLAARQADALALANGSLHWTTRGMREMPLCGLGEMSKQEDD